MVNQIANSGAAHCVGLAGPTVGPVTAGLDAGGIQVRTVAQFTFRFTHHRIRARWIGSSVRDPP